MTTIAKVPGRYLCQRCKRPVDRIEVEHEAVPWQDIRSGMMRWRHTGRVTVTIECHGQRWQETYSMPPPE